AAKAAVPVIEPGSGGPTVAVVEPHTAPAQALSVAEPAAAAYAAPALLASSLTLMTSGLEELQVTSASCSVLPPLNVPVAVKRSALSRGTVGLLGASEMETRFGGVSVAGWYSSALPTRPLLPKPPAISTMPLFNSVAVSSWRALFRLAAGVKLPAIESYSSAPFERLLFELIPAATSTRPLLSSVAVWT